jgi:hypothetical protein
MYCSLVKELKKEIGIKEVDWLSITVCNKETNNIPISVTSDKVDEVYEKFKYTVYDSGCGMQEVVGTVVFKDGTWLERQECNGSEWWEHKVCPKKEDYLES